MLKTLFAVWRAVCPEKTAIAIFVIYYFTFLSSCYCYRRHRHPLRSHARSHRVGPRSSASSAGDGDVAVFPSKPFPVKSANACGLLVPVSMNANPGVRSSH